MSTEPLPQILDIRKAVAREASVSGVLSPSQMPRFAALLASEKGTVNARLQFGRDDEDRDVVQVSVAADVEVTCQRCLGVMPLAVAGENALALVWSDEQAKHLPRHLDPLIVSGDSLNLWDVAEEELMLSLPQFNYHDEADCNKFLVAYNAPAAEDSDADAQPNPFSVLAQLKPGERQE
ncbi:MAG: YceD family protein [Pseudomonadota bacterium]